MAHPQNKADRTRIGKLKAKKRLPDRNRQYYCGFDDEKFDRFRSFYETTTTVCSNPACCGNPRRARGGDKRGEKLTLPERKRMASDSEAMEDY